MAVIGNGASAIQIVTAMQPKAGELVNYIRSPSWIMGNYMAQHAKDGKDFEYTEEEKREFRDEPDKLTALRRRLAHE